MNENRRPKPRAPLRRLVRVHYARFPDFIEAVTANISESGMFIQTATIRPVGGQFDFSMTLTDGFTLIDGSAEVIWISIDEDGMTTGMGVRFVELVGDSAQFVRRIVEENLRDGEVPFDVNRS